MGLFDFVNKAQETVNSIQKKAEELQAKANSFASGIGIPTNASAIPTNNSAGNSMDIIESYTCPICGNHEESGKKKYNSW